MEGKLIKDLATDIPEPKDLLVWWDKTEGDTNSATVEDVVLSGLPPITQAGTVLTARLDLQGQGSLEWSNGTTPPGGFLPTYGLANAGEVLTVSVDGSGTEWAKAAGGGSSLPDGDATNSSLVWDTTASKWAPSRIVKEAQNIHGGTFGTICYQLGEHLTGHLAVGTPGQVLTVKDLGMGLKVPEWQTASALPATTVAEAGKVLSVKTDGTGAEWKAAGGGTPAGGEIGQVLHIDPATGLPGWAGSYSVNALQGYQDAQTLVIDNTLAADRLTGQGGPTMPTLEILTLASLTSLTNLSVTPKLPLLKLLVAHKITRVSFISIYGHANIQAMELYELKNVYGDVSVSDCPHLTGFSLTATIHGDFTVKNCPLVQSGNTNVIFRGNIDYSGCGIVETESLLASLVKHNGKNGMPFFTGSVNLSGGTNVAPKGQGIIDAQTLIARGCTVTVNGAPITTTKKAVAFTIPDYDTAADRGKVLAVKADGSGLEWLTK